MGLSTQTRKTTPLSRNKRAETAIVQKAKSHITEKLDRREAYSAFVLGNDEQRAKWIKYI